MLRILHCYINDGTSYAYMSSFACKGYISDSLRFKVGCVCSLYPTRSSCSS